MNSSQTSQQSFYTALSHQLTSSPPDEMLSQNTATPGSMSESNDETKTYRSAIPLPVELRETCSIYLEEGLYLDALTLLKSTIESGTGSSESDNPDAVFLPSRTILRLACTLLVHPLHTTRASSPDRLEVSSQCLQLLYNIFHAVGPLNAQLNKIFVFTGRRRQRRRAYDEDSDRSDSDAEGGVRIKLANEGSIWEEAQDFWQVVGWAFNCSLRHRHRWNFWKVWLEFMVDVLEADWKDREKIDFKDIQVASQRSDIDSEDMDLVFLKQSLLARYLSTTERSQNTRRIVKALFADGSIETMRAYPEVFQNETKLLDTDSLKRKRDVKVDIDAGEFGDVLDEDEAIFEPPSSQSFDVTPPSSSNGPGSSPGPASLGRTSLMGGPAANSLRFRLLALILNAGDCSLVPTFEVYNIVYEIIRPLPLADFQAFFSPVSSDIFPDELYLTLIQFTLRLLIQGSSPAATEENYFLNQNVLQSHYLPYASHHAPAIDNAKVSILIELLFRILARITNVEHTPELVSAVEKGITAREAKAEGYKRGRRNATGSVEDDEAKAALRVSSARLRILVQICGR